MFKLRVTVFQVEGKRALARLAPDGTRDLLATARDPTRTVLAGARVDHAGRLALNYCVLELVPLLDDTTPIGILRAGRGPLGGCASTPKPRPCLLGWASDHDPLVPPELGRGLDRTGPAWRIPSLMHSSGRLYRCRQSKGWQIPDDNPANAWEFSSQTAIEIHHCLSVLCMHSALAPVWTPGPAGSLGLDIV